jgi:hypothetical protein
VNESEEVEKIVRGSILLFFLIVALFWTALFFSSCTLNVIMTHTEGNASDVVDSNPSTEAEVTPTVSVPVVP